MSEKTISTELPASREASLTAGKLGGVHRRNHTEWIDALRGFAAMLVIIFHSRVALWVGFRDIQHNPAAYSHLDRFLAWFSLPIACGGSAVMLFFLISGFCIHLPYAASDRPFSFKQYGLRRAFRILPPYLFAVVLTCGLEWLAYSLGGSSPTPFHQVARVALLSQNYGSDQLYTNGSLWSLPVEVELYIAYLAVYFLLMYAGKFSTGIVICLTSLLATTAYLHGIDILNDNFLRFWAIWCAGALLADWFKRKGVPKFKAWNGIIFLIFLAAAIGGEGYHWPSYNWYLGVTAYLWAGVYFHVIWIALSRPESIYKFPAWCVRLFVWMGTISYSAYLIHAPVFVLCGFFWTRVYGAKPASFLVPLFFSAAIWPVAWVFWKGCEYPFHQLAQRLAKRNS